MWTILRLRYLCSVSCFLNLYSYTFNCFFLFLGNNEHWPNLFVTSQFPFYAGLGTTEAKDEYRPSFMDHFDKMFEPAQTTTNHVNERRNSDSSTNSQVVMRRTESPFSPPKKFGPGDFEFVSSHFCWSH